jgi:hypothetical protein
LESRIFCGLTDLSQWPIIIVVIAGQQERWGQQKNQKPLHDYLL